VIHLVALPVTGELVPLSAARKGGELLAAALACSGVHQPVPLGLLSQPVPLGEEVAMRQSFGEVPVRHQRGS
jgi:hypothetical protein